MSFLDSVVKFGKAALGGLTSNSIGGSLARTAVLGFLSRKINDSIRKKNDKEETSTRERRAVGVREKVDPDTDYAVPVVYGDAWLGGAVTDARLVNGNQTMWYCLTLCEQTGNLIDGTPSEITFRDVTWNDMTITFTNDGYTVNRMYSPDGVEVTNFQGLIKIFPFAGNSDSPVKFSSQGSKNNTPAYNLFPGWTQATHPMSDLVFCLVRVDYNANKGSTGLANIKFRLTNSMRKPGDVLNDYMSNTRYGAGIAPEEINR